MAKKRILDGEYRPEDSEDDYVIIDEEREEYLKKKTTIRLELTKEKKKTKYDKYRDWLAENGKNGYIGLDWDHCLDTKRFWKIFTGRNATKPALSREESFESRSSLNSVRGAFR